MAKSVKLADIAAVTNVSAVTVSKALSNQKGVSEELREKIKKVAESMGYQQPSAIKKKENRSYNIGVVIADMFLDKYDSFYWQMYQAVTKKAVSEGCFTLLEVVSTVDEQNEELPKLVQENKVHSIIVIGRMSKGYLKKLKSKSQIPVLYLDFYDGEQGSDSVISDSFLGTYQLTDYLFQMGHNRIGFVGTVLATASITDRYLGYTKALLEHGIKIRKDWIIKDRDVESGKMDGDSCYVLPEEMPTAFVCNCDLSASYLIRKLNQMGYRVPEDISVVGYDNYLYPGLCEIGITTYEVNIKRMAHCAVRGIIKKMTDEKYELGISIVEGRLVYKDSVARV